jgi:Tfp pilus assembly protein PilF
MWTHHKLSRVSLAFAGLSLVSLSGCGSLQSRIASLTGSSDSSSGPAAVARRTAPHKEVIQTSAQVPGVVPEPALEVTNQKRANVYLALGEMLEGVGKLEQAQEQYEEARKLDPKSLKIKLALARVYARLGRPDAALRMYETAEKEHRKSPAVHNDKGMHLAEQKQWPAAIQSLRKATELDPTNSKYHNNLGMVLAHAGKYDEAWEEFRKGVGPGPAHYNLGFLLVRAGRTAEARRHLQSALQLMPTLHEAEALLAQIDAKTVKPESPQVKLSPRIDPSQSLRAATLETRMPPRPKPAAAPVKRAAAPPAKATTRTASAPKKRTASPKNTFLGWLRDR